MSEQRFSTKVRENIEKMLHNSFFLYLCKKYFNEFIVCNTSHIIRSL